jgi:hypothetical protein
LRALMASLGKHRITYLQADHCFGTRAAGRAGAGTRSDAELTQLIAHPGLGGYYTADECDATLIPGAFKQYDRLRRLDPGWIAFAANLAGPQLALWRDVADVIATDPYPTRGARGLDETPRTVAQWTATARAAVQDARPIMTVLPFFTLTSDGDWPTLAEMRDHAYTAIVEGARGLWWWSIGDRGLQALCPGWCAEKTAHMASLRTLVDELADLEAVLLADDAPLALAGNSNGGVKTKVKLVDGTGYVFAYNTSGRREAVTFTWSAALGTVRVNGEERTLSGADRMFSDSFGPFAAHLYVIEPSVAAKAGN